MTILEKNNKGFTLLEILLAIALISIIVFPLTLSVTTGYKSFFVEDENIEVMQNGRIALDRIVDNIRHYDPGLISIDFEYPVEWDVRSTALIVGNKVYYLKQNGYLIERIDNGTENDIARFVKAFNITPNQEYETSGILKKLDIEIQLKGEKTGREYRLKTSVYLRNR